MIRKIRCSVKKFINVTTEWICNLILLFSTPLFINNSFTSTIIEIIVRVNDVWWIFTRLKTFSNDLKFKYWKVAFLVQIIGQLELYILEINQQIITCKIIPTLLSIALKWGSSKMELWEFKASCLRLSDNASPSDCGLVWYFKSIPKVEDRIIQHW